MSVLSIVTVYNDLSLRQACLDRSLEAALRAGEVEYIPVDNRDGQHPGAGHALNQGAAEATGDVLAFVQQDVFLHSIDALERAAARLRDSNGYGMLGAVGIDANGRIFGRIRDRVVLLGRSIQEPVEVDSVDEVLFLVSRPTWERLPIDESPELAWHAYAAEYALRLRHEGLRSGAIDIPLTHNSLNGNLAGLAEAQADLARRHPAHMPFTTTCGVLRTLRPDGIVTRLIGSRRWRYRWLRKSLVAARVQAMTGAPVVLGDIRRHVDDLFGRDTTLRVVNLERQPSPFGADPSSAPLSLPRGNRVVEFEVASHAGLASVIEEASMKPLLLTNLEMSDLTVVAEATTLPKTIGVHEGIGLWALVGGSAAGRLDLWPSRSLPAGARV